MTVRYTCRKRIELLTKLQNRLKGRRAGVK